MSHWFTSPRWNVLFSKTRSVTVGSFQLLQAMASQPRDLRNALVSQAREEHNPVAISFLKMDREVGLVRYHGIQGYLQEKNFSITDSARRLLYGTSNKDENEAAEDQQNSTTPVTASSINTTRTARVAFMITATQKTELERLGFGPEDIKKITPLQAMLILEHNVKPNEEMQATVEKLVIEYNTKLEEEQKIQQAQIQQEEKLKTQAPPVEAEEEQETLLLDTSHPRMPTEVILESTSEEQTSSSEIPTDVVSGQEGQVWFEVVETRGDVSEVVALYSDKEEAKLCLEIKEGFANRCAEEHSKDESYKKPSFTIRHRK